MDEMESHPIHPHALLHQLDGSTGLSVTAVSTAATSCSDIEKENQQERSTEKKMISFEKFGAGGESACVETALCDAIIACVVVMESC
eukprot:8471636-Ditylum_brightwellii.AAC.1